MKTTYLAPATDIILLSVSSHILEGSGGALLGDDPTSEPLDLGNADETNATSGNLSRRMWEDEEEEEDY
jgi:hypothetical protein